MQRIQLIQYGPLTVTPDVAAALDQVTHRAKEEGFLVHFSQAYPAPLDPLSMVTAGRCVLMRLVLRGGDQFQLDNAVALARLWSVVVPLQFTPWDRDPLPSQTEEVFHFLGPWQTLYERMIASGRGEHAWASAAVAAQCDAGVWKGDREVERFVQAQLHRIGHNPGPLDGRIGPHTLGAIHALGLKSFESLEVLAQELASRKTGVIADRARVVGHVVVPGKNVQVNTFGKVRSSKTPNGVALAIDGPGRVVIDIGE